MYRPRVAEVLNSDVVCHANNKDIQALVETLQVTNELLSGIADTATGTLKFFRTWLPIGVGIAGVLWPSIGEIIRHLPT